MPFLKISRAQKLLKTKIYKYKKSYKKTDYGSTCVIFRITFPNIPIAQNDSYKQKN